MNDDPINPYAAPLATPESDPFSDGYLANRLAGRFTRLVAAMIDTFLIMLIYMPIFFLTDFMGKMQRGEAGMIDDRRCLHDLIAGSIVVENSGL